MPSPARKAAPSPVVSSRSGRSHRDAELVGLQLQQQVVGRRAAVDPQRRRCRARAASPHVAHLEGDRLQRGPDEVRAGRAAGDAEDGAARGRVPVRRAEPGQRRHEHHAAGVGHGRGQRPRTSAAAPMMPQPVAQPLHGRAGDEDRALERVGRATRRGPSRPPCVSRPASERTDLGAGVDQHERARCRRCTSSRPARSRPARTARPAGRRRSRRSAGPARGTRRGRCGRPRRTTARPRAAPLAGTPNSSHSSSRPGAGARGRTAACGRRWRRR